MNYRMYFISSKPDGFNEKFGKVLEFYCVRKGRTKKCCYPLTRGAYNSLFDEKDIILKNVGDLEFNQLWNFKNSVDLSVEFLGTYKQPD